MSSKSKKSTPQKPTHHPYFKAGAMVEASSDDDGFRGSWYIGKIVRRATTKDPNKFLVEYETLFRDEVGKNPLKEIYDVAQLRPLAPREKNRKFRFGEKVDAYHSDGWWEGSITEECEDGKFAVYFKGSKEQIVFGSEVLRLHREWVDGEWKPPLEVEDGSRSRDRILKEVETVKLEVVKEDKNKEVTVPTTFEVNDIEAETEEGFSKGMEVEISSDEEGFQGAWFAGTIVEAVGKNKYLIEYKNLRTDDDTGFLREEIITGNIRPCPPETVMLERFKYLDEVDALYNDGWWVGVISKVLGDEKYIVYFRDNNEELTFRHSELRLHQDWIAGEWIAPSSAMIQ
ncbi:protein AGENET DOMAIN (AGD)-CONTAINING P1 [Mercurialis annua]|uniref:protein AGENET DOMAIN (AGD)-CONTAINING P1 n=1 Tax=Mercurialis annua TaxID=3986 RepID=UPI00215F27DC|nr:protein AGENET DOMAIN (AGD)-CONTAINING P1 [Mercurialis annua]